MDTATENESLSAREELSRFLQRNGFEQEELEQAEFLITAVLKEEATESSEVQIEEIKAKKVELVLGGLMTLITHENVKTMIDKWAERRQKIIEADTEHALVIKEKILRI